MNTSLEQSQLADEVKGRLVLALGGTTDVVAATLQTVGGTLAPRLVEGWHGTVFTDAITVAAQGCIRGVTHGGGDLNDAAKGIIMGVMRGPPGTPGPQVMDAVRHAAKIVIRETSRVGGNLGSASAGLIHGAILGAKDTTLDGEEAATMAVEGALEGARQVGSTTFDAVRIAVIRTLPRRRSGLNREEPKA